MYEWSEAEKQEISVIRHAENCVNKDLKSLILHGDADIMVPYEQSYMLRDALTLSCGKGRTNLEILHGFPHAGDAFYSNEQLARVESFLRSALNMD